MTRQDPSLLHLLKGKEEQERDRRRSLAAQAQDRLSQVQAQTEQLEAYRRHYQSHWQLQFRSGASPQVLQCYRQFVERLDSALAQQAHTLRHVAGLVEQADQDLLQQEVRVAAIEKLLLRRQEQAQIDQRKAEQRTDDEWAQRATRSASPVMAALGA